MEVGEAIRAAPFALFGLPRSFAGQRWLAEYELPSDRTRVPSMVALGHGDPQAERPNVLKVGVRSRRSQGNASIDIYETLLTTLVAARLPPLSRSSTSHQSGDWLSEALEGFGPPDAWPVSQIEVDQVPTDFKVAEQAEDWVGVHQYEQTWLFCHSLGMSRDTIELVQVTDLTPYLGEEDSPVV